MIDGFGTTPSRSSARRVFLWVSALVAVGVVLASQAVMLPFVLALVVAYVLTPAVRWVERRRIPRWAAILLVYAATLGTIGGFVGTVVPRLVTEGRSLVSEWPKLRSELRERWLPVLDERLVKWSRARRGEAATEGPSEAPPPSAPIRVVKRADGSFDVELGEGVQIRESGDGLWRIEPVERRRPLSTFRMLEESFDKGAAYMRENAVEVLKIGRAVVATITRGIFNLFMTLMLGAYMILTHEKILGFFRELCAPASREAYDRFLRRLDRGLSGVVRGQLLICLVNGVLSAIGFWLFDLKYWPILSIVAAVMSLIPIFGSILSSIPAVAIGLTQSPGTAFGVLAWIVGIHQLEANFLNPKIIGDAAKIHPVLVVFSLLVGEHFFQIAGALFAVPCMSIAQTIFLHFRESTMGLADPTASIPPPNRPSMSPLPLVVGVGEAPRSRPTPTVEPAAATPVATKAARPQGSLRGEGAG